MKQSQSNACVEFHCTQHEITDTSGYICPNECRNYIYMQRSYALSVTSNPTIIDLRTILQVPLHVDEFATF